MIRSICFAIEHFVDFISILYGDLKKEKKLTPSLTLSLFSALCALQQKSLVSRIDQQEPLSFSDRARKKFMWNAIIFATDVLFCYWLWPCDAL